MRVGSGRVAPPWDVSPPNYANDAQERELDPLQADHRYFSRLLSSLIYFLEISFNYLQSRQF